MNTHKVTLDEGRVVELKSHKSNYGDFYTAWGEGFGICAESEELAVDILKKTIEDHLEEIHLRMWIDGFYR